jgi:hypothetical protein
LAYGSGTPALQFDSQALIVSMPSGDRSTALGQQYYEKSEGALRQKFFVLATNHRRQYHISESINWT